MQNTEKDTLFLKRLSKMDVDSTCWEMNSSFDGLSQKSIDANLSQYGSNIIT